MARSWNGQLPTVMTNGESSMIPVLDVNQFLPTETTETTEPTEPTEPTAPSDN